MGLSKLHMYTRIGDNVHHLGFGAIQIWYIYLFIYYNASAANGRYIFSTQQYTERHVHIHKELCE